MLVFLYYPVFQQCTRLNECKLPLMKRDHPYTVLCYLLNPRPDFLLKVIIFSNDRRCLLNFLIRNTETLSL